jgi:hypothetical protein
MDPAEADALRAQLQHLVDDYQPAPGETPADATEAILRQIQQDIATYADEHDGADPGVPLPDALADVRAELNGTLDDWTPPEGMDPAEAEALRAQLHQMVADYQPAPGESPADATEILLRQIQQEMATYADEHDGTDAAADPAMPTDPGAPMANADDAMRALESEIAGLDPSNPFDADRIEELQERADALRAAHAPAEPDDTRVADITAAHDPAAPEGLADEFDVVAPGGGRAAMSDDPTSMTLPDDDLADDDPLGVSSVYTAPMGDLDPMVVTAAADNLPSVPDLPDLEDQPALVDPQISYVDADDLPPVPDLPDVVLTDGMDDMDDDPLGSSSFDDDADLSQP